MLKRFKCVQIFVMAVNTYMQTTCFLYSTYYTVVSIRDLLYCTVLYFKNGGEVKGYLVHHRTITDRDFETRFSAATPKMNEKLNSRHIHAYQVVGYKGYGIIGSRLQQYILIALFSLICLNL